MDWLEHIVLMRQNLLESKKQRLADWLEAQAEREDSASKSDIADAREAVCEAEIEYAEAQLRKQK
jgi:hypothetical protein